MLGLGPTGGPRWTTGPAKAASVHTHYPKGHSCPSGTLVIFHFIRDGLEKGPFLAVIYCWGVGDLDSRRSCQFFINSIKYTFYRTKATVLLDSRGHFHLSKVAIRFVSQIFFPWNPGWLELGVETLVSAWRRSAVKAWNDLEGWRCSFYSVSVWDVWKERSYHHQGGSHTINLKGY